VKDKREKEHNAKGQPLCGAKLRNKDQHCRKIAMQNGRCELHGGRSIPPGPDHPRWKHGRRSKAMAVLEETIAPRVEDPNLLDPRRAIAIQESVLAQLVELEDVGDGIDFRENARRKLEAAKRALAVDPVLGMEELEKLERYLRAGEERTRTLEKVAGAADMLSKGQERFWKIAMQSSRAITADELVTIAFKLADIIEEEVDRDAARKILQTVDRRIFSGALGLAGRSEPAES